MKLSERESACLDFIRALASQAVVFGHGISFYGVFNFLHEPNFPWVQNIAVVIFFILSGFVITYSAIIKSKKVNYGFKDFFIDRASRIFSAYFIALLFVVVIDYLSLHLNASAYPYGDSYSFSNFIANVLMLQDYPLADMLGMNWSYTSFGSARVFWTISIEWWIYMFFGVLFFLIIKNENKSISKLMLYVTSCIVVAYYMYSARGGNLSLYWSLGMLWLCSYEKFKSLVIGFLPNFLILLSTLMTCIYIQLDVKDAYNFNFALFLSVAVVSAVNLSNYIPVEKARKVITLSSSYSFTLYLIHYSMMDFIARHFYINNYLKFLIALVVTNVAAFIISRYSEFTFRVVVKNTLIKILAPERKIITEA